MQDLNTAFIRNTANSYLSISFFSLLLAQGSPYGTQRALKEHYIVIVFFLFAVLSYNILQYIATVTTKYVPLHPPPPPPEKKSRN